MRRTVCSLPEAKRNWYKRTAEKGSNLWRSWRKQYSRLQRHWNLECRPAVRQTFRAPGRRSQILHSLLVQAWFLCLHHIPHILLPRSDVFCDENVHWASFGPESPNLFKYVCCMCWQNTMEFITVQLWPLTDVCTQKRDRDSAIQKILWGPIWRKISCIVKQIVLFGEFSEKVSYNRHWTFCRDLSPTGDFWHDWASWYLAHDSVPELSFSRKYSESQVYGNFTFHEHARLRTVTWTFIQKQNHMLMNI